MSGHGRDRPHPAGVGAGVALADRLVVARGREARDGAAVGDREQRHLGAGHPLLDDHRPGRPSPKAAPHQAELEGLARVLLGGDDHDALAGRQPVGLDATGRPSSATAAIPASTSVTVIDARGGHARRGHDLLREGLAALEARGGGRRPEGADARGAQARRRAPPPAAPRARPPPGRPGRRRRAPRHRPRRRGAAGSARRRRRCRRYRRHSRSGAARASVRAPSPGRARAHRLRRPAPCDSRGHSRTPRDPRCA